MGDKTFLKSDKVSQGKVTVVNRNGITRAFDPLLTPATLTSYGGGKGNFIPFGRMRGFIRKI